VIDVGESLLTGVAFLVGRWRGEGMWREQPFTCRTQIAWLLGRYLQIDAVSEQEGRAAHAEHIVIHADGDRTLAMLYPDRGSVQHFEVLVMEPGEAVRLVFTPPAGSGHSPQRWTLRRTEAGYDEVFEIADGGGEFQRSVTCSYVRDDAA
jgi:hypothetical protein